ncbi:MAG: hypothetical protein ACLR13_06890 [Acutalibacteraceae bacterium]
MIEKQIDSFKKQSFHVHCMYELGNGAVPMKHFIRRYRETVGRICQNSKQAE